LTITARDVAAKGLRGDQIWLWFFVFIFCYSIFMFLMSGCFFVLALVSSVLVKELGGKSIFK